MGKINLTDIRGLDTGCIRGNITSERTNAGSNESGAETGIIDKRKWKDCDFGGVDEDETQVTDD